MWDKHSKEEYDNRIMGANATNAGPNVTNVGANVTNVGANATNVGANATNVGAKKEKKQQKKDRFSEKMIIICKMKEKALAELSEPLEVEVTDLLWEDNID